MSEGFKYLTVGIVSFVIFIFIIMGINPIYNVWHQELAGKAELARAESNRKISILEAQAKQEAAKMLAQAEIERAKGVAEANKIIGSSLKGNEDYLRYLWIDSLHNKDHSIIYIPTEAGLPILEANRTRKYRVESSKPRLVEKRD